MTPRSSNPEMIEDFLTRRAALSGSRAPSGQEDDGASRSSPRRAGFRGAALALLAAPAALLRGLGLRWERRRGSD